MGTVPIKTHEKKGQRSHRPQGRCQLKVSPECPHPLRCRSTNEGIDGDRRGAVERWCDNCEHPNSSLLRVVLIAEIIRAEEEDLLAMADIFDEMGLLQLDDDDNDDPPSDDESPKASLRRIK